jgi:NAD(P)-dependent dehydrogenase (short-subunit alcohol dehydrogenase family)
MNAPDNSPRDTLLADTSWARAAQATAERQRAFQSRQDERDRDAKPSKKQSPEAEPAVQSGPRDQPDDLPAQHLAKPGLESALALAPRFDAPDYRGSGKLEGMTALVTGGDSGIGRAVAVLFAREGADVALIYLNEHDDATETLRCIEAEGRRGVAVAGDVRDPAFCRHAVAETVEHFGRLDVLVNNAAFQLHAESLEDIDDERLAETLQTNVLGYMLMARAALPHLERGASIINTGSVTGLEGSAKLLDYSTTKGAIHAFTKSLASNLMPRGIRVNAVAPGPVWTPLNPADSPAEKVSKFGKHTDMHRAAQPEEISPAYVFLASPVCSGYISGVVLPITGSVGAI